MKLIKSKNWIRLRGQVPLDANAPCKIDTPIFNEERVFFVPETEMELGFFKADQMIGITGMAIGPTTHDPDQEWGWRFSNDVDEEKMRVLETSIEDYMQNALEYYKSIENTLLSGDKNALDEILSSVGEKKNKILN